MPGFSQPNLPLEVCILAGGLSTRMGRDKAQLRLSGRTLLARIRRTVRQAGLPVRVVRRDLVPRCGPIGGVYTGLKRSRASAVLFLSCDMPFVSPELLLKVAAALPKPGLAAFTLQPESPRRAQSARPSTSPCRESTRSGPTAVQSTSTVGFPFVIRREALPAVQELIEQKKFALQDLAAALAAKRIRPATQWQSQLFNINAPADWRRARELWRNSQAKQRT